MKRFRSRHAVRIAAFVGCWTCAAMCFLAGTGCQTSDIHGNAPSPEAAEFGSLKHRGKLSPSSKALLGKSGLRTLYRADPAAAIRKIRDESPNMYSGVEVTAIAGLIVDTGASFEGSDPKAALGWYLAGAHFAWPAVAGNASTLESRKLFALYNHCCTRAAVLAYRSKPDWNQPLVVKGPIRSYELEFGQSQPGQFSPGYFDIVIPAESVDIKEFEDHEVIEGVGGTLVGQRSLQRETSGAQAFLPASGMELAVTATLDFFDSTGEGSLPAKLVFHDPLVKTEIQIVDRKVSLAANYTAPLGLLSDLAGPEHIGIDRMFHPDHYLSQVELFQVEPFRKDKIPIVLVHGLSKSPIVWRKALNELRADPVIRKNYQFFLFRYPTGFSAPYCGALLRGKMEKFQEHFDPNRELASMRRIVLIGKSLGGLTSSLQVRDSGETLRELFFATPLDKAGLPEKEREVFGKALHFKHNPDIRRVVFMGTPHQGTDVADKTIVKLATKLINYSMDEVVGVKFMTTDSMTDFGRSYLAKLPTSVENLESHSKVSEAIAKMPFAPDLTIHSIVGKIGDDPLEESTDKMVPYWSSHLDNAVSEAVIPCKHGDLTTHPNSIEELRRILLLHLNP